MKIREGEKKKGQSLSLSYKQKLRLNYSRKVHTTHMRDTPGAPGSGDRETVPLGCTGQLLHMATLPRSREIAGLPNA